MAEISKTVDHALHLLILLGEKGPSSSADLARAAGLNRTVVHRLLTTLHDHGFIARTEAGYIPGTVIMRMASQVYPELRAAACQAVESLADETAETVVLDIADGDDAVVLDQAVAANRLVRVKHDVGSRHSLEGGAGGRALLAFLELSTVERVVSRQPEPASLRSELEQVRQRGYAISHDELQDGVYAAAVPVLDAEERVVASLAVLVPATRATDMEQYVAALLAASRDISDELLRGSAPEPVARRRAASA